MINKEKIKEKIQIISDILPQKFIRLDSFLFKKFPEYSRSYFQNLIKESLIQVNESIIKKNSYKVLDLDKIEVSFPEERSFELTAQKVDFEIVDIQKDFIIINKPANLLVHPSKNNKDKKSVAAGLLYNFAELKEFNDKERPGIVHRIDKDTSGLLIAVRNIPAQIKFSQMFKNRKIHKTYLALVKKHPPKEGTIDFPIGRNPKKRYLMSHCGINPKTAITHYKTLVYYKDCSLVQVKIITGRTHQIRVHFAAIGHGVIGDSIYGYQSKFIKRQALHAWKLEFEYKGKNFSYTKSIPQDFKKILKIKHQAQI